MEGLKQEDQYSSICLLNIGGPNILPNRVVREQLHKGEIGIGSQEASGPPTLSSCPTLVTFQWLAVRSPGRIPASWARWLACSVRSLLEILKEKENDDTGLQPRRTKEQCPPHQTLARPKECAWTRSSVDNKWTAQEKDKQETERTDRQTHTHRKWEWQH